MDRKKRIALYGGTFDPIHLGHLEVAKKVSRLFEIDELLFVLAQAAPHKLLQDSDGWRMFQGVTMDGWSLPVSYRLMLRIQQAYEEIVEVRARDSAGR